MTKAIRMEDPSVETHPNGTVSATVDKLLKVPQVQANGKTNEKTIDDVQKPANDINNVKPTADVVVPLDGGWGWVVVLASFVCCLMVDGIVMTAGLFKDDMKKAFGASTAEVSTHSTAHSRFSKFHSKFVCCLQILRLHL